MCSPLTSWQLLTVYFADVQLVEMASKSLSRLAEKNAEESSPSKSGDAGALISQGTPSTARDDDDKGSQS